MTTRHSFAPKLTDAECDMLLAPVPDADHPLVARLLRRGLLRETLAADGWPTAALLKTLSSEFMEVTPTLKTFTQATISACNPIASVGKVQVQTVALDNTVLPECLTRYGGRPSRSITRKGRLCHQ